jgi:hypothetical protein
MCRRPDFLFDAKLKINANARRENIVIFNPNTDSFLFFFFFSLTTLKSVVLKGSLNCFFFFSLKLLFHVPRWSKLPKGAFQISLGELE